MDLIAYQVKYHSKCLYKSTRDHLSQGNRDNPISTTADEYSRAFNLLCTELDVGFAKGHIYTLSSLKGLAQAEIIKKSVILFRVLNMTI